MLNIRQIRPKENSLSRPALSLQLAQIVRLIQQYEHSRMLHNINLGVGNLQSYLPLKDTITEQSDYLLPDVPYIQSEHYESSQTFTSEQIQQHSSSEENFTDDEEIQDEMPKQRKFVILEDSEEEYKEEDFQFVSKKISQKQSQATFPHSSTILSSNQDNKQPEMDDELDLFRLQQTAYFSQAPEAITIQRRLSYGAAYKQNQHRLLNQQESVGSKNSKKAMFLHKIQKQKSKKEEIPEQNRRNNKKAFK